MPDADASLAILNGTANFFDQFDSDPDAGTPSEAPSRVDRALSVLSAPPGGNFFDRFDEPPAVDHTLGRSARNIGQGAATGAATSPSLAARSLPGPGLGVLPGTGEMADAAAWAVNNAPRLWGGKPTEMPAPGSPQQINDLLAQVGLGTQASPAQDTQDRIEQGIGQTAGAFVAPAAGVRALGGKALAEVGPYVMGKNLPLAATVGATAGATGSVAREIAPDNWKNVADVAGQLIGGGALAGGRAGAQGAGRTIAKGIDYFRLPGAVAKSAEADLASGAIPRAAPGEPSEVGQLFQRQLDHADQLADAHISALQQQSKQAAENLPSPSTQDSGQQMRGLLDQANRVAKTREVTVMAGDRPERKSRRPDRRSARQHRGYREGGSVYGKAARRRRAGHPRYRRQTARRDAVSRFRRVVEPRPGSDPARTHDRRG